MRGSSTLTALVIIALIAIGGLGHFGVFRHETPRYEPERPREAPRRPRPDDAARPDGTRPLSPPSSSDPGVQVDIAADPQSSIGTAFSLERSGLWMTARHVADGCSRIFVLTGARAGYRATGVYVHQSGDIAILRTDRGAPPVALSGYEPRVNQTGYHFGYPHGEPGAVQSTLLGRATLRARGRYNTNEPVLVWAERERVPESEGDLGGISGGPAFDSTGHVIGVTVAGSSRRGRVFTADVTTMRAAITRANVTPATESAATVPKLNLRNWVAEGASLRGSLSVAKVICLVDRPSVRQRGFSRIGL